MITTADLLAAGLSYNAIARRVRSGVLRPVHRGVYLFGAIGGPQWAEVAALKACGPRTVLSHQTALALWDLRQPPGVVHVTRASVRGDHEGVRQHRAELVAEDVTVRHGLPVTAAARTLLDVASATPAGELARVVEEAQVQRLATRAELVAAMQRGRGRRGVPRLRAALREHDEPALTRSEAERRLLGLIRAARLPAPRTNVRIGRHEVDFAWPEQRLVVEVDGFAFHGSRAAFERDRRRDAELLALGYRVLRITWRRLIAEPEAVVAELAGALSAARSA